MLEHLGMEPGYNTLQAFQGMDSVRIQKAELAVQLIMKETKLKKRVQKLMEGGGGNPDDLEFGASCYEVSFTKYKFSVCSNLKSIS